MIDETGERGSNSAQIPPFSSSFPAAAAAAALASSRESIEIFP
jgi:hypothetical protein